MPPQLTRQARQAGEGARPAPGSVQWELKEPNLFHTCLLESLELRGVGVEGSWGQRRSKAAGGGNLSKVRVRWIWGKGWRN